MSVVTKESNPELYNALFPEDEIKEILLKDFNEILVKEFCTDWKEKRLYIELLVNSTPFSNLLDYITNLQEENEILEINNKTLHEISVSLDSQLSDRSKQLQDYKTRNDKAIDKIQNMIESNNGALSNPEHTIVAKHKLLKLENDDCKYLLNILQGKSDE